MCEEAAHRGDAVLEHGEGAAGTRLARAAHIDAAALRPAVRANGRVARDCHAGEVAERGRQVLRREASELRRGDLDHLRAVRRRVLRLRDGRADYGYPKPSSFSTAFPWAQPRSSSPAGNRFRCR